MVRTTAVPLPERIVHAVVQVYRVWVPAIAAVGLLQIARQATTFLTTNSPTIPLLVGFWPEAVTHEGMAGWEAREYRQQNSTPSPHDHTQSQTVCTAIHAACTL